MCYFVLRCCDVLFVMCCVAAVLCLRCDWLVAVIGIHGDTSIGALCRWAQDEVCVAVL